MPEGYCTVGDVRRALRKADLPGDAAQDRDIVIDAIAGQTARIRSLTGKHFYASGGIDEDSDKLIPTGPRTRSEEEHDIPSTPHAQHDQMFHADADRYPLPTNGPYARITLDKEDADGPTAIMVRQRDGTYDDWVAASDKTSPEDYRLHVAAGDSRSRSYLDLNTRSLPVLSRWDSAVRVSYDYGLDEVPRAIRRAHANLAAASLAEDAAIQVPNNAEVYGVQTLADELEQRAMDILDDRYL